MALRDEGDDRRGSETDVALPGQLRSPTGTWLDAGGGKGDVGEAHQQQPTIRTISRLGEPDQGATAT